MARKSTGERGRKSQLMREYLSSHGHLKNPQVAALVEKQGVACKPQDIANMRTRMRHVGIGGRRATKLSVDDLLKVKALADEVGGIAKLENSIAAVENQAAKVGGWDRLKRGLAALQQLNRS